MTVAVRITNEDALRTIVVHETEHNVRTGAERSTDGGYIGPGESRTFHVHAARDLRIIEDPNAAVVSKPSKETT